VNLRPGAIRALIAIDERCHGDGTGGQQRNGKRDGTQTAPGWLSFASRNAARAGSCRGRRPAAAKCAIGFRIACRLHAIGERRGYDGAAGKEIIIGMGLMGRARHGSFIAVAGHWQRPR
jgi:hypothetical protein